SAQSDSLPLTAANLCNRALGSAGVASEDIARLFEALEKNGGDVEEARSWFDSIKENLPVKALPLVAGILGLFFGVPPFAG
ncbi:hypothetical protein, partial [Prescottella equi]|uniref:hypothetical protein n=1 Tax=Rhodococcus hoagii TaxID=43767 RepID=UPI0019824DA5